MKDTNIDRRKTLRVQCDLDVEITGVMNGKYQTNDISPFGMFVKTQEKPEIDSKIFVRVSLPDNPLPINTFSKVRWVRHKSTDSSPRGIGVEFLSISEFDSKRLIKFLKVVYDQGINVDSNERTLADYVNSNVLKDLDNETKPFWNYIEDYKDKGYYIYQKYLLEASQNTVTLYDKSSNTTREYIMMGSSNYLGLNMHPKVIQAGKEALKKYGSGAVGSPLHTGSYDLHRKLEDKIAEFEGMEDTMLFPSGYTANLGAISALVKKGNAVVVDRDAHASILDGCLLSGGTLRTFKHSDMNNLEYLLNNIQNKYEGILIVVDGVYSSAGDIAPVPELLELSRKYGAKLLVDDAHGTGVMGKNGCGTLDHFGLKGQVNFVVGTLSKTLSGVGGFISSSKETINYLRHYSRSAFFSASIPPVVVSSVLAALEVMEEEPERHKNLIDNINYFKENLNSMGFDTMNSESALVPILVGDDLLAKKMSKKIYDAGIYISVFPYPSVPKGKERLRISILSTHTKDNLNQALDTFYRAAKELSFFDREKNILAS